MKAESVPKTHHANGDNLASPALPESKPIVTQPAPSAVVIDMFADEDIPDEVRF